MKRCDLWGDRYLKASQWRSQMDGEGVKTWLFFLLKTALRWWYWVGTWDRSKGSWDLRVESEELWIRQVTWHVGPQLRIVAVDQSRWGLCWRSRESQEILETVSGGNTTPPGVREWRGGEERWEGSPSQIPEVFHPGQSQLEGLQVSQKAPWDS